MSFINTFKSTNDRDALVKAQLSRIISQESSGSALLGEAMIRRVALTVAIIREGNVVTSSIPFNVERARRFAAQDFDRVHKDNNRIVPLGENNVGPTKRAFASYLHPYVWNGLPFNLSFTKKQVISQHTDKGRKSDNLTVAFLDMIDNTDRLRRAAMEAFRYACLYIYLDDDGTLFDLYEDDNPQLAFKRRHFVPVEMKNGINLHWEARNPDNVTYLRPINGADTKVMAFRDAPNGGDAPPKSFNVSMAQLVRAWTLPTENSNATKSKGALFQEVIDHLPTKAELTADERVKLEALRSAVLAWFQANVRTEERRNEASQRNAKPAPETRKAKDIAKDTTPEAMKIVTNPPVAKSA